MNKKQKFNIENYPGKYAMHVTSEGQAKIFCNYLHSLGRTWFTGHSYAEKTYYTHNTVDTCYAFNSNLYSSVDHCNGLDYTILEFDDFNWEE